VSGGTGIDCHLERLTEGIREPLDTFTRGLSHIIKRATFLQCL
jgi:hypothetical protein